MATHTTSPTLSIKLSLTLAWFNTLKHFIWFLFSYILLVQIHYLSLYLSTTSFFLTLTHVKATPIAVIVSLKTHLKIHSSKLYFLLISPSFLSIFFGDQKPFLQYKEMILYKKQFKEIILQQIKFQQRPSHPISAFLIKIFYKEQKNLM